VDPAVSKNFLTLLNALECSNLKYILMEALVYLCFDTVSAPGFLLLEIVQFVQVLSKLHHLGMRHRYHIAKTNNPGGSS
jgi:hypothetical protein